MSFGVEDPLVEGDHRRGGEEEVEILEGLGKEEALHLVVLCPGVDLKMGDKDQPRTWRKDK